jgi:predicted alpha/beta hydrolase
MLDSSDAWIINGRNNSIAFILADLGYDVWLPNCRGNDYSLGHQTLDSKNDVEYWNNAYILPISKYDLPAFITHAEKVSNSKKVIYMGHSQGSQAGLVLYGTNSTWWQKHVKYVVAMGSYLVVDEVKGRANLY